MFLIDFSADLSVDFPADQNGGLVCGALSKTKVAVKLSGLLYTVKKGVKYKKRNLFCNILL